MARREFVHAHQEESLSKTTFYALFFVFNSDQVVPAAQPPSLVSCEKKDNMLPFVGLNNLGNTCYLNSVLQVRQCCLTGLKRVIFFWLSTSG